jgi:hypothetical protein
MIDLREANENAFDSMHVNLEFVLNETARIFLLRLDKWNEMG